MSLEKKITNTIIAVFKTVHQRACFLTWSNGEKNSVHSICGKVRQLQYKELRTSSNRYEAYTEQSWLPLRQ